MQSFKIIAFPGASNWPLQAGQELGFFAREGLDVSFELTPNSRHMARTLHTGAADIALSSVDNVVAYVEGQGEEPLDGPVEFFSFMGVDNGMLSLMVQPEIREVTDLRGRRLAVDAMTTGFAFVLREILHRAGVGDDVSFASVGSGKERLSHLQSGSCAATLLNAPLCLQAEASGKRRLVRALDVLDHYQGIVGVARRSWAAQSPDLLIRFIRGFHASLEWLRNGDNRADARELLIRRMPDLANRADEAYEALLGPGGLTANLEIDRAGLATVMSLRQRYSGRPLVNPPEGFIDDSFRRAALDR